MIKHLTKPLIAAATLAFTALAVPEAGATKLRLDGYGSYEFLGRSRYIGYEGIEQTGRYQFLGRGYYHRTKLYMDFLTNRSRRHSGDMSLELWAMNYYGATTGTVLMTELLGGLDGYQAYNALAVKGAALDINRRRYPELNLWEYTRKGWKFRDALTFKRKNRL